MIEHFKSFCFLTSALSLEWFTKKLIRCVQIIILYITSEKVYARNNLVYF